MKTLIIAGLFMTSVSFGQSNETLWVPAQVIDSTAAEKVVATGYVTETGKFRLEATPDTNTLQTGVESSQLRSLGRQDFQKFCDDPKTNFSQLRSRRNEFRLTVHVPILAPKTYQLVTANGSRQMNRSEFMLRVLSVKPKLRFDDRSYLMRFGKIDPALIENLMNRQLAQKFDDLRTTGELSLAFSGLDDMACDFVNGLVEVGFEIRYNFQAAKQARVSRITGEQLEDIQDRALTDLKLDSKKDNNSLVAAAELGIALRDATNLKPSSLGSEAFEQLFSIVFDVKENNWRPRLEDYVSAARKLDQLKNELTVSDTIYKIKYNGGIQ